MRIDGKRALVTGATGGLGRAIARALAEGGAQLVLSSRKEADLQELADSLPGSGHTIAVSDLAEPGAAEALAVVAGKIDLLVANAGLPASGWVEDFSPEEISRAVRVNLEAPMILARLLMGPMIERGEGHLVFVSSLAGKAPSPRASLYNGTKFGLRGFALALREDLIGKGTGVSASVVMPGFIRDAGMFADSGSKTPPGVGTASPEEVATGVIRAVESDRAEVAVAPPQQRALAHFAHFFPAVSLRAQRGGGTKVAEKLAKGQTDKR
ncbi:MAG: SDR family NAD(P)-dependent oxidoreductase [Solirubrobacterales bacterium]|nr:SDR family NAD(P)-dependent oxidoreductase [Solirubrobacterales bacterium]